jgi:hypothetical protein
MDMKRSHILLLAAVHAILLTACGEDQRRGAPQENMDRDEVIRPGVDGAEATGQSPNDTLSRGDRGATSY